MWILVSTLCIVIVGILGRAHDGVLVANPDNIKKIGEIVSSEETVLPDNIIGLNEDISDEFDISDEIELPDDIDPPEDTDSPEDDADLPNEEIPEVIDSEEPTVVITQGTVVGSYSENRNYMQFYGIPYADATSGNNRFKAPNPPPSFQDTFIANRRDIKCVRPLGAGFEGTEDCLVANIFTSTLNNSTMLPVMVWVKGKEFVKAYDYEPSFGNFIDQGVVIVTLNYRESVLGFLCLGTEIAPGNAGLKDIIAGLRWVQGNIAQFGGNPNDITLVGHGSGAAAVDLVTLSPMANGLVHKAIAQSGNALSPWAVSRDSINYAVLVAEALGHIITDIDELSEVFQRTSIAALMGVINELDLFDNSLAFAPCIEKENLSDIEPFMVKSPYQSFQDGDFLQIPFITGYVDNEGTIRSEEAIEDNWLEKMDDSFAEFIQPDLQFDTDQEKTQIAQNIRSFYFRDDPINMEHVQNYINYHGDTMILVSALREVRLRVAGLTAPVFVYQFSYKGSLGEPFVGPLEVSSAAHSEELAYLFHDNNDIEIPMRDRSIGDILVERWSWFAKTGQPLSASSTVFWPAYTTAQSNYLRILDDDEINEQSAFDVTLVDPHPETLSFWDEIYEDHFLDAEGKWNLTEKDENEDSNEEVGEDGEEDGDEEGSAEGDNGEEGSAEGGIEEEASEEDSNVEEGSAEGDNGGEGSEENGNGEEEDDGEGNSAEDGNGEEGNGEESSSGTSVVGYTFSIIALFTILNKLHLSQMLA